MFLLDAALSGFVLFTFFLLSRFLFFSPPPLFLWPLLLLFVLLALLSILSRFVFLLLFLRSSSSNPTSQSSSPEINTEFSFKTSGFITRIQHFYFRFIFTIAAIITAIFIFAQCYPFFSFSCSLFLCL